MDWVEPFLEEHEDLREYVDLIVVPPTGKEVVAEFSEFGDHFNDSDLFDTGYEFLVHDGHGHGLTRLAQYVISRRKGNGHKLAVSFAMQRACTAPTNDTFWGGRKAFWQTHGEVYANDVRRKLATRGVNLGPNDEYMPELARFRGDTEAVVSFDGGRDHIRKVCQQRGWACDGAVTVKGRGPDVDPHVPTRPVHENLMPELAGNMVKKNPDLARKTNAELRQMVYDKHGPTK